MSAVRSALETGRYCNDAHWHILIEDMPAGISNREYCSVSRIIHQTQYLFIGIGYLKQYELTQK